MNGAHRLIIKTKDGKMIENIVLTIQAIFIMLNNIPYDRLEMVLLAVTITKFFCRPFFRW